MQPERVVTEEQLQRCHALRIAVFVGEQKAPLESEIDGIDGRCAHWILDVQGDTVGAVRLVPLSATEGALGRLCVARAHRRKGLASLLVAAVETEARLRRYATVSLHAQTAAVGFYLKNGYQLLAHLGTFLEDGILHNHMLKTLLYE